MKPQERVRAQKEARLVTLAQGLIIPFIHENELLEGRQGVVLAILDITSSILEPASDEVHIFDIGTIPPEKLEEKRAFAKEKVLRLQKHTGHLTSFESQNENAKQYGGGVRVNKNLIIAASAFPPFLDQEFCILLTLLDYQMTLTQAMQVRKRTLHEYPHPYQPYLL